MNRQGTYLTKPLDTDEVIATVEGALRTRRPIAESRQVPGDPLGIIVALAITIDAKDPHTHGHSARVARYAAATAEELGLEPQEIENILYAGLLHDIGKIGVSEQILHKPAILDVEEWGVIKAHPITGAKILEPIPSLQRIIPLVRHHHERYDGTGYPQGLTGKEIPLGARILAVADAFEAMTYHRPYRRAMPLAQAAAILKEGMGKQWDAEVVKAFLKMLEREMPYQLVRPIMIKRQVPITATCRTQPLIGQRF
jgi:putative nucleotidyltransferase with HDIG domain